MAIREGRWDCPTCGTVGVLGRQVNCPNCATPRPEGVRFYLPEDAAEVTDSAHLARARAGADWICEHCDSSTPAAEIRCSGCGAERGSSPAQGTHDYDLDDIPRDGRERRAAPQPALAAAAPRRRRWKTPAFVVALVAGVMWCNGSKKVEATVAAADWERAVEVQDYRTVREEDWSVPQGGRQQRSWRAIRDYRQVLDHYENRTRQVSERVQTGTRTYTCGSRDLGNGHFEDRTCTEPEYTTKYRTESYQEPIYRQEPIYDTKFAYEIERWLPNDTVWARGNAAREPSWPAVKLDDKEREGARIEKYVLHFRDKDGKTYQVEVPLDRFSRYRPGQAVQLRVPRVSSGKVEIVEPEKE
ncbi:MAG TPA: hypothetical protein VF665_01865 [Longimicrobium sp.]|uniref:hypothetical protein n=1 Tax=Longimicrobium sp. TaxID=2029185 RepID=UPI002EDB03A7